MAKIVEFAAPIIGIKKPITVKATNRIMRRIWKLQLQQAKQFQAAAVQEEADSIEDIEAQYERTVAMLDESEAFLIDTLKLTKKQQEALEDLTMEELGELVGRLEGLITGIEKDEDAVSDEVAEPDPK